MRSIKKWLVLFLILIFPYIIVQIVERSTHNILTLGYVEKNDLDLNSLGEVIESVDSLKVPEFKLINQERKEIDRL